VAILSGLPFVIMLYMVIVNPEYISPLFTTRIGMLLLVIGASIIALGIFIMTRMIKIDV
jgi:tight adherence protein B